MLTQLLIQRGEARGHAPQTHEKLCNYHGIVAENLVKYMPPDGFFGIQILQNSILTVALPWTPLGELMMLPQAPSSPSHYPFP